MVIYLCYVLMLQAVSHGNFRKGDPNEMASPAEPKLQVHFSAFSISFSPRYSYMLIWPVGLVSVLVIGRLSP